MNSNIFLCHTPFQNFIASKIIEQDKSIKSDLNIIVCSDLTDIDTTVWNKVFYVDKKKPLIQFIKLFFIKIKLNKIIRTTSSFTLNISHTAALIDNYYFHNKKTKSINLMYEGILYFYEYKQKKQKTFFKRKLMSFFFGFNYLFNPVILPVKDDRVKKIYTILPELTIGDKNKLFKINLEKNIETIKNSCLILGGKPSLLSDEDVQEIYFKLLSDINANKSIDKIYFKGHHSDFSNNFFEVLKSFNIDIIDITQPKPVEEVFETYKPYYLFSYPSSGLINLKVMYGNNVQINTYYPKNKINEINMIINCFEKTDINVYLI